MFLSYTFLLLAISGGVAWGSSRLANDEVQWILGLQQSTGSILMNKRVVNDANLINPYIINMALTNVLRINTGTETLSKVKLYLNWYLTHINEDGTIWDHKLLPNDSEVSNGTADSTDSYAATYLSLVKKYVDASGDREWPMRNSQTVRKIADAVWLTYNSNLHLTRALPNYHEYYLMDNVEVWEGLKDYGELLADLCNPDSEHYHYRGELIRNGIYYKLWNADTKEYSIAYNSGPPNWSKFYSDAAANMWPVVFKLPDALLSERRKGIYDKFKTHHLQNWLTLKVDDFPYVALWEAVKINESPENGANILNTFVKNVKAKYYPERPWTWHIGEAAAFAVLLNDLNSQ